METTEKKDLTLTCTITPFFLIHNSRLSEEYAKAKEEGWKNVTDKNLVFIEPTFQVSEPVGLGTRLNCTPVRIFIQLATPFLEQLASTITANLIVTADKNN